MTTAALDSIIRAVLLRRGYSIHWYLDALLAARDCFRELNFDTLGIVNTKLLPLDDASESELPDDFADVVGAYVRAGQYLRPLVPANDLNTLPLYEDGSGAQTTYSDSSTDTSIFSNLAAGYFWRTVTWNQYGENVGRLFGFNEGYTDTYQLFRNRNIIKVNEQSGVNEVVLKYISDGMNIDAATHVETYAISTIESYIMWQFKEMNRTYSDGEKERARQLYLKEYGILRARKADWSIARIKRISQKNNYGSPKS